MLKYIAFTALFAGLSGTALAQDFPSDLIEKGRYVATASDCVACHTSKADKPFAGNHKIASPVGDIFAPNITPSKTHGIGNYTEEQFANAVRRGIRADGANLYPAMPYTAFSRISDEDMKALYAYFMAGVDPINEPSQKTDLPFPFNLRFSMIGWNMLFRNDDPHQDLPEKSAEWNRGAYLAEGPAHCSTCHTPRGALMQEDTSQHLAGAQVGAWYAPNITSDKIGGIGSWSKDEIVTYLATGRVVGKSQSGGSMAEAVSHSFSKLNDDDLNAIATYIMDVPPVAGPARTGLGEAGNLTSQFRGVTDVSNLTDLEVGAKIYSANCASCHGYNGQGTADQYYPSLFHNTVTAGDATGNFVAAVLNGVDRKTDEGHVFMPPFGTQVNAFNSLNDAEVAALANYAFAQFGDGQTVTAEAVAEIRDGGPKSNLLQIVRGLMAGGAGVALVVVLTAAILLRRRRNAAMHE